jgi:hypothetical protein
MNGTALSAFYALCSATAACVKIIQFNRDPLEKESVLRNMIRFLS